MELLGVDGINGDTMDGVGAEWWEEGTKRGLQLALEPEVLFNNFTYLQVFHVFLLSTILFQWDVMSWAYWYRGYNMSARTPPLVSAYKAITGGRHLVHICER